MNEKYGKTVSMKNLQHIQHKDFGKSTLQMNFNRPLKLREEKESKISQNFEVPKIKRKIEGYLSRQKNKIANMKQGLNFLQKSSYFSGSNTFSISTKTMNKKHFEEIYQRSLNQNQVKSQSKLPGQDNPECIIKNNNSHALSLSSKNCSQIQNSQDNQNQLRGKQNQNELNFIYNELETEKHLKFKSTNNQPEDASINIKFIQQKGEPQREQQREQQKEQQKEQQREQQGEEKLKKSLKLNDFKLGQILGQGKYGKIYQAKHIKSGVYVALKELEKSRTNKDQQKQIMEQIKITLLSQHPNVIKLYSLFDSQKYIYLVMELASSGNLYTLLQNNGRIEQELAKSVQVFSTCMRIISFTEILNQKICYTQWMQQRYVILDGPCKNSNQDQHFVELLSIFLLKFFSTFNITIKLIFGAQEYQLINYYVEMFLSKQIKHQISPRQ